MPKVQTRELLNLGPKSRQWLLEIGISTVDEIESMGVLEVYRRLKLVQPNVSLNMLWGLQGAVLGIDWRDIPDELKQELRRQLEDVG